MDNLLKVAPSPHVHSGDSVAKNMVRVIVALLPAYAVALYSFGVGALVVSLTAMASCVLFEYLIQRFLLKGKCTINNYSALLTGLLLSFNLPSNLPWWIVVIGAAVAIGIGKMCFGGLGNNPFNPALVGRVFLLFSFPVQMTTWPRPLGWASSYLDAETMATPLALIKGGKLEALPDALNMFLANTPGSLGEISALALLIGGVHICLAMTVKAYKSNYMAYSGKHSAYSGGFFRYFVRNRPDGISFATCAFVVGRYDAWSHIYGNRLCNLTDDTSWHVDIWIFYRYNYNDNPCLGCISRRYVVCDSYYECFYADYQ